MKVFNCSMLIFLYTSLLRLGTPYNRFLPGHSVLQVVEVSPPQSQAMMITVQPLSVVLLDWVDIVVAEVSDATCTSLDYGMITLTLCLVPFAYYIIK